jgi:2-amino-4-hydroxy-6-hydroxymethyldihydropteridine diphosphokinase
VSTAVLSLGSNLGDRLANLRLAVAGLGEAVRAISPVYETAPWGIADQPDFLNAVLIASDDELDEWGWLTRARELETKAGRVRTRHWGPRTLDVDVVTVDEVRSADPELLLPHPGTPDRATVLVPWLAIDPNAELLDHGRIVDLLARLDPAEMAAVRWFRAEVR